MIKAILFDMDGVLIDAKDWHYEALNQALDLFGFAIDRDTHLSTYDGLSTRTKLRMLSKSRGLPEGLHEFLNALKQRNTMSIVHTSCFPTFHHRFALGSLKRDGYKLAVCSNSVRASVVTMMDHAGLTPYLEFMLSNEDVPKPKPAPDIYITAMKKLGVKPEETLILEDNDHGIEAARASGGNVLVVGTTEDVTYWRIKQALEEHQRVA